jgi:hypothetical protein
MLGALREGRMTPAVWSRRPPRWQRPKGLPSRICHAHTLGDATRVQLPHPQVFETLAPGVERLLADGKLKLQFCAVAPGRPTHAPKPRTWRPPLGASLFKAAYSRVDFDDAFDLDAKVDKFAIGYEYQFSKRTAIYATASRIRVSNGQNNPVIMGALPGGGQRYLSTGNNTVGFAPSRGTGYDLGLRHVF